MTFSDRIGITKPRTVLQTDSIDTDLRNGLWQTCIEFHLRKSKELYSQDHNFKSLMRYIYVDFFKRTSDLIPPNHDHNIRDTKKWFFSANWYDVYNFVEFLLAHSGNDMFGNRVTFFLEREKSGYRILDGHFVPITDPAELASVSDAMSASDRFAGAREHMQTAVRLFSQKPDPDYRNSIKEAISAVESVARLVTGNPKATLGDALKTIGERMPIHPALREAMSKLYGYASDEGGIRHASLEESNIDEAEAKFMIVACSAFVNFCVQRSAG
jgi:AbiJ N-terminal domain 4